MLLGHVMAPVLALPWSARSQTGTKPSWNFRKTPNELKVELNFQNLQGYRQTRVKSAPHNTFIETRDETGETNTKTLINKITSAISGAILFAASVVMAGFGFNVIVSLSIVAFTANGVAFRSSRPAKRSC